MNALKNNNMIRKMYYFAIRNITKISPKDASKLIYHVSTGRRLNLKKPQDFNQKIMWLKLNTYYNNPLITQCADKYAVRKYIAQNGCDFCLNDLIAVYDSVSEINWAELPQQFAIKCNHGCGYNIICSDKNKMSEDEVMKKLSAWMKEDYYLQHAEVNYKFIKKRIICEKFLTTLDGHLPNDYKIYCMGGKPVVVLVCYERDSDLKLVWMDMNWKPTKIGKVIPTGAENIIKPDSFDEMIELSKILSQGFPFVRMDFYDVNGKAIFGEMTFSPAGGVAGYYSDYGLEFLGNQLKLPI